MSATRLSIHLLSVAMLLLWGGVMLYFHASGRIQQYLPPDGIFQPMVLVAGIGLMILALFNLMTIGAEEGCGHDHTHDDSCGHDHHHDHDHDHAHSHAHPKTHDCGHGHHHDCGHDHHDHGREHEHEHGAACGHDHHHHGHDHHGHEPHGHGMLEESGAVGRLVAIFILVVPLSVAAWKTPDSFSPNAVINKGLYNPNYADTSRADQFSLKRETGKTAEATGPGAAAVAPPSDAPPADPAVAVAGGPDSPPAPDHAVVAAPAGTAGSPAPDAPPASQSYGSFTLEDLEAQVPRSSEGNFILDVPEIYYTGGDLEVQAVLTGQPVETVAQVLPEKVNNDDGHRLRIFRMLVQCCAADARPYSIPIDFGKPAPDLAEMTWVKVSGTMTYQQEGGQTVPVLKVEKVEETTAPDQTMIY